jgi:AhpD family alkylhydroperoxidase
MTTMTTMSKDEKVSALKRYASVGEQVAAAGISAKERELAAVGISVAAGCKPCTDYHLKAVREAGASNGEVERAVADALRIRGNALAVMERHAWTRLDKNSRGDAVDRGGETTRIEELVAIGAAFAVNCTSSLAQHLAAAKVVGITDDEVKAVARLAAFIKMVAASHVEKLAGVYEDGAAAQVKPPTAAGCGCG